MGMLVVGHHVAVADQGNAVYHIRHMRFAPMEMMENRLLGVLVALRIRGNGTGLSAAHADICPVQASGGVWLGKGKFVFGGWYGFGCGFGGCLGYGAAAGAGLPYRDPLRVRIAGSDGPLGYWRTGPEGGALETKKGQTLSCPLGTRTL